MSNKLLTPFQERLYNRYGWGINWRQIEAFNKDVSPDDQKRLIAILDSLPHGSGIDSDWSLYETKSYYCFTNSYHAMDDSGMYDGWADFTIKVLKSDLNDKTKLSYEFVLQFNGDQAQYLNRKHYLRDYLWDTIHYGLWLVDNEQEHK